MTDIFYRRFILFHPPRAVGLSIKYPSIALHAIQRLDDSLHAIFLQINTGDGFDDHDPEEVIELKLVPSSSAVGPNAEVTTPSSPEYQGDSNNAAGTATERTSTSVVYDALSACADLHPDPMSPTLSAAGEMGEDDSPSFDYEPVEGLPPPMPGSRGWITSENINDFFDADGNWRGGSLGPGAGIVRGRDEDEVHDDDADGDVQDGGQGVDTKWRRIN